MAGFSFRTIRAFALLLWLFCIGFTGSVCAEEEAAPRVTKTPLREGAISLVAVGDIFLGDALASRLERNGHEWPFVHVQSLLRGADIVTGNLEGPLTSATGVLSSAKKYSYKADPQTVGALKHAGFDAFSLSNNHTLDYGLEGMRETIRILRENKIAFFGAGESESEARRGVVFQVGSTRIGLLSYGQKWNETAALNWEAIGDRPGCALLSPENLGADIARLKRESDVVIVSAHWGSNYKPVTTAQRTLGRRAIDLGADIVFGHHPHIAQDVEIYRGKPIAYSLGNFVFGTRGRFPAGKQGYGLVARCVFENKRLRWLLLTPIAVNNRLVNFQPRRVEEAEAKSALAPLLAQSNTDVRWNGDTAFIGFFPDWQQSELPSMP